MSTPWKSYREQEKKLRVMMTEQRKRAERKAEYFSKRNIDPKKLLRVDGNSARIIRDTNQYNIFESKENLMLWNGRVDNLIDRFDGRSLLDYIPEPIPPERRPLPTDEELELESMLNFERWRPLVENERQIVSEKECLAEVAAHLVYDITTAPTVKEKHNQIYNQPPLGIAGTSAVPNAHAAIGFSYADSDKVVKAEPEKEESDSDDSESDEEEDDLTEIPEDPEGQANLNKLGRKYGVDDYSRFAKMDNREIVKELDRKEEERLREKARIAGNKAADEKIKNFDKMSKQAKKRERKKFRRRFREAAIAPRSPSPFRDRERQSRGSPTYEDYPSPKRKRSKSPAEPPKIEYITEFSIDGMTGSSSSSFSSRAAMPQSPPRSRMSEDKKKAAIADKPKPKESEKDKKKENPQERLKRIMRASLKNQRLHLKIEND